MTSTTATQSATQSLNFVPQWLRSASTSDSAVSMPSSNGSGSSSVSSGTVFKFSATRCRYSKDEIIALRANVSKRLAKDVRNEIVKNLKEVENIYRPQILDPLSLSTLSADETAELNSLSNYVCGRNSGGATRSSSNTSQSQVDPRKNRDNRSLATRIRSSDDRDQAQTARRDHGNARHSSDDWRRSRGDDDDNKDHKDDSSHGSNSRTTRNGPTRRVDRTMEQRTKSDEKWNHNDNRSNSSHAFEPNQSRDNGWRRNATTSDRHLHSRRPQPTQDEIPEWMDDNLDGDTNPGNATFDQDGTFTQITNPQQPNDEKNEEPPTKSASQESLSQIQPIQPQAKEITTAEKSPSPPAEPVVANISNVSQPSPPVQKPAPTWDDDFDHHDLATTVVESTLADDHDYSPPISSQPTPRSIPQKPSPPIVPTIPQQQQQQTTHKPVIIDDKQWFYKDPQNTVQGPFSSADMERWFNAGYFTVHLPVKRLGEGEFSTIKKLSEELGRLPFLTDVPPQVVRPHLQTSMPVSQKTNSMPFNTSSNASNAYFDQYFLQQQQQAAKQNAQNSLPYHRQSSVALTTNDFKSISSQSQTYVHSQQPSSALLSSSNALNDPAIIYSQQRTLSSNNLQQLNSVPYDDSQRSLRHSLSQSATNNNASFFPSNVSTSQRSNNILSRLAQAAQIHDKQQQEKIDEQRLREQRLSADLQRLRLYQQGGDQERFKYPEDELRHKHEQNNNRSMMSDPMKKMSNSDVDPFLTFQQSIQYKKEQQAQIDAMKAENVRRYQQHYQEVSQQSPLFRMPEANHWSRQASYSNDQSHSSPFMEMQDPEQERLIREAASALLAHQNATSETSFHPNTPVSTSTNRTNPWVRTVLSGSSSGDTSRNPAFPTHPVTDANTNENPTMDLSSSSPSFTAYNQQATDAVLSLLNIHPKSRGISNQQTASSSSPSWNVTNPVSNPSFQDIHRQQQQQMQNDARSHPAAAWDDHYQRSSPSYQPAPSSTSWDNAYSSLTTKPTATNSNKSSYVSIIR